MYRILTTVSTFAVLLCSPAITRADAVSEWNAIMVATVSGQNPFAQARFAAITQLAVFEAVNAITGDYNPYLGTITAPTGASVEAAAVAAAHAVLRNYFPDDAASLDAARAASLARIRNGWAKNAGIAAGEAAATAMITARANDGSGPPQFYMPLSSNPGEWLTTPSCPPAGGVLLHWRNVTPFGIESADQFRPEPPPVLTSTKYTRDYNEVKAVGGANSTERPQDRADVAQFYAAVAPIPLWSEVARQIAVEQGTSLSENARVLALLSMAISDGAVSVFETKYHDNFWRPETAIRAADTDDNPKTEANPTFVPFITTPCFPGYPSAHATLSNAAREVLERIYDNRRHYIKLSSPAVPGVMFKYTKLKQITDNIDDARVYGGIHFRFDQEAGSDQGRRIGEYVYKEYLGRKQGCRCDQRGGGR
jgi:hypothetical protein